MPKGIKGFQPGHKLGTGRPKKLSTMIKDFQEEHPKAYDELMNILMDMAKNGDKDSAIYIIDRLKGRPHISIDSRLTGTIEVNHKAILERANEIEQSFIEGNYIELEGSQNGGI